MLRRLSRWSLAVCTVAVALVAAAVVARADNVVADGDNASPIGVNVLNFFDVCPSTSVTKPALVGLRKASGNRFRPGTAVVITALGAGPFVATMSDGTIAVPIDWNDSSAHPLNTFAADTATVAVTINTATLGSTGSRSITLRANGINDANGAPLLVTGALTVTANVSTVACDTTAPELTLPNNITEEATSPSGAVVTFSATATDANPTNPSVTCSPASGSTFPLGTGLVSCSATDAAGNSASESFTVSVVDTTEPTINNTPSAIITEAQSTDGAVVTYVPPTASDIVSGEVPVICGPAPGSTFTVGASVVACNAVDFAGNVATSAFTVLVQDTTEPVLALPGPITAEATGPAGAGVSFAPTASDAVDGAVPVTCVPPSASTFELGSTTVSCSAEDTAHNVSRGGFSVTVVDTTGPVFGELPNQSAEATGPGGAAVAYESITADDLVDGTVPAACEPPSSTTFALGETTVRCSAMDAAGNSASAEFKVTVVDTTAPNLTLPLDTTLEATGPNGAVASFEATAADAVDPKPTVACTRGSGSVLPLGTNVIECTATDAAGNVAVGSFIVTVVDTMRPTLALPNPVVEATSAAGAIVTYVAGATDTVDADVPVACSPNSGSLFAIGDTNVTCRAEDDNNNVAESAFTVTVQDTTPPALIVPETITVAASAATVDFASQVTASDTVDAQVEILCSPASGATFPAGQTTNVTCIAADDAGNQTSKSFTVTVGSTLSWTGFVGPISNTALNTVTAGQVVAVKFGLGGDLGLDIFAPGSPSSSPSACAGMTESPATPTVSPGARRLTYDAATNSYSFSWKTDRSWAGTCRTLSIRLTDGSLHQARFGFR